MNGLEPNNDDVVLMDAAMSFKAGGIFKVDQLHTAVINYIGETFGRWFTKEGVTCQILRTEGGGWQKGKMRFRIEFIPDEPIQTQSSIPVEPRSPLDDLRSP